MRDTRGLRVHMKDRKKITDLYIDETDEHWGINAISVVDYPAIEKDFMAFKKAENYTLARFDKEQRIIIGPALIPGKKIVRYDEDTNEEYLIRFPKETVKMAAHLYLKRSKHHNTTEDHKMDEFGQPILEHGCMLVESWITESPMDKAAHLGFKVPVGTWMVAMKIDNDDMWKKVKAGKVRGFSIEGYFTEQLDKFGISKAPENLERHETPTMRELLTNFFEAIID